MIRAYQNGKLMVDLNVGDHWPYYDLASLTKVIFTTQALMLSFEEGHWTADSTVGQFLPWYPHPHVKITQLLSHASGLPGWLPLYKEIDTSKDLDFRRAQLKDLLCKIPLGDTDQSVYSDMGFLLLGFCLEAMEQKPLIDIWKRLVELFYAGTTLEFHPNHQMQNRPALYAPTEEDPWRGRLLQGEVHDENAWSLGGVAPHAGLFGSIDDLGWVLLNLRAQLFGIGRSPIRMKTAQFFAHRARPVGHGDWALGFMMPTPGRASCGSYFSLASIGHTGFTGTSLWYDPKTDLAIAILSNRVLYGRDNPGFKELRPQIHNWVVEGLRKSAF